MPLFECRSASPSAVWRTVWRVPIHYIERPKSKMWTKLPKLGLGGPAGIDLFGAVDHFHGRLGRFEDLHHVAG